MYFDGLLDNAEEIRDLFISEARRNHCHYLDFTRSQALHFLIERGSHISFYDPLRGQTEGAAYRLDQTVLGYRLFEKIDSTSPHSFHGLAHVGTAGKHDEGNVRRELCL